MGDLEDIGPPSGAPRSSTRCCTGELQPKGAHRSQDAVMGKGWGGAAPLPTPALGHVRARSRLLPSFNAITGDMRQQ